MLRLKETKIDIKHFAFSEHHYSIFSKIQATSLCRSDVLLTGAEEREEGKEQPQHRPPWEMQGCRSQGNIVLSTQFIRLKIIMFLYVISLPPVYLSILFIFFILSKYSFDKQRLLFHSKKGASPA